MNKQQYKILKQLKRGKEILVDRNTLFDKSGVYHLLLKEEYVRYLFSDDTERSVFIEITESGKGYIEHNRRAAVRYWIPIVISLAALIKSFWVELLAVLKELIKLLR